MWFFFSFLDAYRIILLMCMHSYHIIMIFKKTFLVISMKINSWKYMVCFEFQNIESILHYMQDEKKTIRIRTTSSVCIVSLLENRTYVLSHIRRLGLEYSSVKIADTVTRKSTAFFRPQPSVYYFFIANM
jgi:hypothetical protein